MRPVQYEEWVLVSAHPPGRTVKTIGILLIDVVRDELYVKFRNDWSGIAEEDEAEIWSGLAQDVAEEG